MPRQRYEFDSRAGRYRDLQTGRLVGDALVRRAIDTVLRNDQQRARTLADDVRAGRISRQQWAVEARQLVTEVHLYSGAAAAGGWKNLTPESYSAIAAQIREQEVFLAGFVAEVNAGLPLDGSFTRRSVMYVQAGRTTFHALQDTVKTGAGMTEEHNVEDPTIPEASHCVGPQSCKAQTALGWQPIGTLIQIGQRVCLGSCRCKKIYRSAA